MTYFLAVRPNRSLRGKQERFKHSAANPRLTSVTPLIQSWLLKFFFPPPWHPSFQHWGKLKRDAPLCSIGKALLLIFFFFCFLNRSYFPETMKLWTSFRKVCLLSKTKQQFRLMRSISGNISYFLLFLGNCNDSFDSLILNRSVSLWMKFKGNLWHF